MSEFTVKQMIEEVENDTELGKNIVEVTLKMLKIIAEVEDES